LEQFPKKRQNQGALEKKGDEGENPKPKRRDVFERKRLARLLLAARKDIAALAKKDDEEGRPRLERLAKRKDQSEKETQKKRKGFLPIVKKKEKCDAKTG